MHQYIRLLPNLIHQRITTLNLFESDAPHIPGPHRPELIKTRIFLLILVLCAGASGFYIFFSEQTQSITVQRPSIELYESLYQTYSTNLECRCSQLSIPYGALMNWTYTFHAICSSSLVSSPWLDYIVLFDPAKMIYATEYDFINDFRLVGISYFQLLAIFCSLAKDNADSRLTTFAKNQWINDHVLSQANFLQQMQNLEQSMNPYTSFRGNLLWLLAVASGNGYLSGLNTNFRVAIDGDQSIQIRERFLPETFES